MLETNIRSYPASRPICPEWVSPDLRTVVPGFIVTGSSRRIVSGTRDLEGLRNALACHPFCDCMRQPHRIDQTNPHEYCHRASQCAVVSHRSERATRALLPLQLGAGLAEANGVTLSWRPRKSLFGGKPSGLNKVRNQKYEVCNGIAASPPGHRSSERTDGKCCSNYRSPS